MDNFPRLDLTFAKDDDQKFLVDASFRLNETSPAISRLALAPPRGQYFRAVCILMLLAKYRGEGVADKKERMILFKDKVWRPTWISALGNSFGKGTRQDFFSKYFSSLHFLTASRGSGTKKSKMAGKSALPSAEYRAGHMPLQNLRFFKGGKNSAGEQPSLMTGEELALFAERLERYETEKPDGWESIVPEIIAQTKRDRPVRLEPGAEMTPTEPAQPAYDSQSVSFTTRWRELNQVVRQRIEADGKKYDWYVVSSIPSYVLEWKTIFCDACLNYNASIKLAYQSPTAVKSSAAIRAQLLMYASRRKDHAAVGTRFMLKRLVELEEKMGGWAAETNTARGKKNRKGGFQFFESQVNHPFAGILAVPAGSTWSKVQNAPPGSFCLLQLFSLYQPDAGDRCCLYLSDSSPMLNVYYNGIMAFFTHGPKDGYLKAVNLPKKESSGNA